MQFNSLGKPTCKKQGLLKILARVIKLTTNLLLVGVLQAHAIKSDPGDKINLSVKDVPLEKVFREIEKQSGYIVWCEKKLLEQSTHVTLHIVNASLSQALSECLKDQPLLFNIVGKTIVISPKEKKQEPDKRMTIDIKGQVTNDKNEPLEKASIEIRGKKKGSFTDAGGKFELADVDADDIVLISFSGYSTREIKASQSFVNIELKRSDNSLDEVQVIAYGTTTKRLNTGSVSTVKAEDIEREPINNPLLALQGTVPGIQVQQMGGLSASPIRVNIRGYNSLQSGTDPLYIIDGVPYTSQTLRGTDLTSISDGNTGNPFSFINPTDIESIAVLKDADATAIYGSRGANGVILVTTKKGKLGRTKVDINSQGGLGKVGHFMKLLNTRQYLDMRYEAFRNDGATPNSNADYDLTLWDTSRNTDWQRVLLGGTAKYTDAQVSISGGNVNTQFLIGTGYHKETTVFPGDFNDQKGSLHASINSNSINRKFKLSFSGMYNVDNNQLGTYNYAQEALQLAPDAPSMYNRDGSINWELNSSGVGTWSANYTNPAANLLTKFQTLTNNLVVNGTVGYEIIPALEIKSNFGYTNMQTSQFEATPFAAIDPARWPTLQRQSFFGNNNIQSWIIEPQITYSKQIINGLLTALVGSSISQNKTNGQVLFCRGFNSDQLMGDLSSATQIVASSLNGISVYKYNAGFGRLNYNWDDKYIFNFTGRRDGSSRFGPANQFHDFWAAGVGWIFSKEDFLKKNFLFLSFGKLRASYGTTGNDQVGNYSFLDLYNSTQTGVPYQGVIGIAPTTIFNPNLAWEETRKLEFGFDLGLFKDRILFSSSFYCNRSSNQLLAYPLASITGFTSVEKNLNALLQNKGWEIELKTVNFNSKNFRWTSSINLSINRNRLLSVVQGVSDYYQRLVDHAVGTNFLYHFLGVDPISGKNQFADSHGQKTFYPNLSSDEIKPIEGTTKFYGGIFNGFTYKAFQLDILWQFAKIPNSFIYRSNGIPGTFNAGILGSNQPVMVLSRWQKPGDISSYQRFSQDGSNVSGYVNSRTSDWMYEDGSFIRLKNMSLSWQFPTLWSKAAILQQARFFIHSQNLFTITKYQGMDPESAFELPPLRVVTIGVQLTL